MGVADFLEFALAVLLIELTPGPNMGWLAALSATAGRRAGLAATLGIAIGLACNALFAALGLATLLAAEPGWQRGLRVAGVLLMLGLAWTTWREDAAPVEPQGARGLARARDARNAFAAGLALNLLNPKAVLFFVAVVPPFLHGHTPGLGLAMALAAVSVGIATAIHLAIVVGASRAEARLAAGGQVRRVRRALALVMAAMGAWMALGLLG
ncbi:MAG: LysE family translocator [Sphingomonadales bacterium]|nr:LysE family translocator [Sphingomonadales bacterium]